MTRHSLLQAQQPIIDPDTCPGWLMAGLRECGAMDENFREAERMRHMMAGGLSQLGGG